MYGGEFIKYLISLSGHFHTLRHEPLDEEAVIDECRRLMVAVDDVWERGMQQLGFSDNEADVADTEYLAPLRADVNDLDHGVDPSNLAVAELMISGLIYRMLSVLQSRPFLPRSDREFCSLDGVEVELSRTRVRVGRRGVTVRVDTSEYEDEHPSNADGPTDLRVVLNDDYDDPLWES